MYKDTPAADIIKCKKCDYQQNDGNWTYGCDCPGCGIMIDTRVHG